MNSITVIELLNVWSIQTGNKTEDFFNTMTIDSRIDKKILFSEFIRVYGADYPIFNNSLEFYNFVYNWFVSRNGFKNIADALHMEYNPIHNYDRSETRNTIGLWVEDRNSNSKREDNVSAFNSTTYQPSNQSIDSASDNNQGNRNENEAVKISGNIGVTTTQQMIESEIALRLNRNLIDIVVKELGENFTMGVY